ncbi:hypothetical protein ACJJTC_000548 [Scirpophaga incertulas]
MEAATLPSKKVANKGKIKKTIKNVLCRPDPVYWPLVSDKEKQAIMEALSPYKVHMPKFEKLHWKVLKQIPKEERPKPPKQIKVDGILFGIMECREAIKRNQCSVLIIDASVNPRIIVQPVIEACVHAEVPVLCVDSFKILTSKYFGIPTSSFGIKKNYLPDLQSKILDIAENYKLPQKNLLSTVPVEKMDVSVTEIISDNNKQSTTKCPYLYRTSKKERVFIPPNGITATGDHTQNFNGQNFIGLSENQNSPNHKSYMKMIVKRISNNSNRVKVK